MPAVRLTDVSIRAFKAPAKGQCTYWDRALGLRVSQGGSKTFVVLAGSGKRRALGRYPDLSLAEARKKAKLYVANPTGIGFSDALELFVKVHCKTKNRPSTAYHTERLLRVHFGHLRSLDASANQISLVLDKLIDTPSEANHAFTAARTFFRWCERRGYVKANPLRTLQMPYPRKRRKRTLTDAELRKVWNAADKAEGDFGEIVRLLMLTGQRRGEIGGLRRNYYSHNQQTICLPGEVTKNHQEHTFPVGPMAGAIIWSRPDGREGFLFPARGPVLEGERCFSGWSKCKKALDKLANIAPWTLHDLRRTFRTNLGRLKVRPDIAERLVNHISARTEMEETYDLYTYLPEMREAMEKWEAFVQSVCIDVPTSLAA
jgi:integrase